MSFGTTPRLASMSAYAGDPPNIVTFASAAIRHSASGSGYPGFPSYSSGLTPSTSELTRKFHIIQPVVV